MLSKLSALDIEEIMSLRKKVPNEGPFDKAQALIFLLSGFCDESPD